MIAAADRPVQRPAQVRSCCVVDARRAVSSRRAPRAPWSTSLRPGDLVIANDAATLPASLQGAHRDQRPRDRGAAGRPALARARTTCSEFSAIVFGEGDFHARPKIGRCRRRSRPAIALALGPLSATVADARSVIRASCRCASRARPTPSGPACAARTTDPIRACADAARAVGRLDADCRTAGRVRTAARRDSSLDWRTLSAMRARRIEFATSSRTPPAFRRPATTRWTLACRSTSRTDIPASDGEQRSHARGSKAAASSPSARPSCARSSTRLAGDGRVHAGAGLANQRIGPATLGCRSSTRSSQACTRPGRATISCCARSPTMRRSTGWSQAMDRARLSRARVRRLRLHRGDAAPTRRPARRRRTSRRLPA